MNGMSTSNPVSCRACWVLLGDGPPIQDGVVVIRDGRILEVKHGGEFDVDLGDAILSPGFVNVHAHLDLSHSPPMTQRPSSFAGWLKGVVDGRRNLIPPTLEEIGRITADFRGRGTIALGDVALGDVAAKSEAAATMTGVTFGEIVGLRRDRFQPLLRDLEPAAQARAETRGRSTLACAAGSVSRQIGFSPHAPYSTAAEVYRSVPQPRCTHWFESPDEMEFLRTGGGPMKDFLQSINALPDSAPSGPWYSDPWAELLGDPSTWLLVHANFVSSAELEHAMRLSNGKPLRIAYCPRTHAAFGFNDYPLKMFLNAGCIVGLGTDSLASNPDLDVWNEAVFVARKFPHLGGERIFRMLTIDGAALLRCDDELGSISPGKRADLLVIRSPQRGSTFDWERFFSEETTVNRWLQ